MIRKVRLGALMSFAVCVTACAQQANEQEADARRIKAVRLATMQEQFEEAIDSVRTRCSESGDEFRRLLSVHRGYVSVPESLPMLSIKFFTSVRDATVKHDPSKPCAGILDSIAKAEALQRQ